MDAIIALILDLIDKIGGALRDLLNKFLDKELPDEDDETTV